MLVLLKLILAAIFTLASFSANAETCWYRYGGEFTKNEAESTEWSAAGDEVIRQTCGIAPPMVPPRAMKPKQYVQQPQQAQYVQQPSNRGDVAVPPGTNGATCQQGTLVRQSTGNLACSPDYIGPVPQQLIQQPQYHQSPQYRQQQPQVQYVQQQPQVQYVQQQGPGGGLVGNAINYIGIGYAANGNSTGVRRGAEAAAGVTVANFVSQFLFGR